MSKINKVLYNVDQTADTDVTWRRMARKNIGLDEVIGIQTSEQDTGIAPLGSDGKVPAAYLPSYVDDVIDGYYHDGVFYSDDQYTTAITPEPGKIYVDVTAGGNSASYRWDANGNQYVQMSAQDTYANVAFKGIGASTATTIAATQVSDTIQFTSGAGIDLSRVGNNKEVKIDVAFGNDNHDRSVTLDANGKATATDLTTVSPAVPGSGTTTALSFIDTVSQDSKGKITATKKNVNVDSTYSASGTNPVNGTAVSKALETLDVNDISGFGTSKTLTALSETDGKISASFGDISITKSQVSDFGHSHGNITDGGALQTTDITIGNHDKLVVTDNSNNDKVARTSVEFDGSTTTEALTKAGTWASFNNYTHPSGSAASKTGVPTSDVTLGFGATFKISQITTDATSHVSAVNERSITLPALGTTASDAAAGNHEHGSITTDGKITDTGVAIGNNDTLVIVDSSDSSKIKHTSIMFDGSTTTEALTKAGTWASFTNYTHPTGSAVSKTGVPTADTTLAFGGTFKVNQITTDATSHVSAVNERSITLPSLGTTASDAAAGNHVHGSITTDGKMSSAGVAIGNNDSLVIVDSSDSSKIKQTSIAFDGSTTTQALTKKGTFETFVQTVDQSYSSSSTNPQSGTAVEDAFTTKLPTSGTGTPSNTYFINVSGKSSTTEALNTVYPSASDFNDLVPGDNQCRQYSIDGNFTNGPDKAESEPYYGMLIVGWRDSKPFQVYYANNGDVAIRDSSGKSVGVWSWRSWKKLAQQDGNYPSMSVGDADTVDGYHVNVGSTSTASKTISFLFT